MNYGKILQGILDIGEEMIICGAEVSRVENSILRMCESYGADRVNVFIITSNIQVTMESPEGEIITQIRRLLRPNSNYDRLDYLNDLCRVVCQETPEVSELHDKLNTVMNRKQQNKALCFFGAILVAGGFCVFFGGGIMDCVAASIIGVIIILMETLLRNKSFNQIIYFFSISLVAGIAAIILVKLGIGDDTGLIMIGGIMLLIPGIDMTNSIRDMLIGDTASGLLRLVNAVLFAAAIASGFAMSIVLTGGVL